jgi:hypothetical protein
MLHTIYVLDTEQILEYVETNDIFFQCYSIYNNLFLVFYHQCFRLT